MNLGENIHNAFEVVNKTHENVEKLIEFCRVMAAEKKEFDLMSPKFLRYKSDSDYWGWNIRRMFLLFQDTQDELCYPQLVGTITLNSGRRSSKNIYEIIKNLPGWGRSFSDLLHFRDWFQIKMNFNRNVSCFIAVYFFMDNDFFNQLV